MSKDYPVTRRGSTRVKGGEVWYEYYIGIGLQIHKEKGRWCFYFQEPTESIPNIVKEFVEEISFSDHFASTPRRTRGVYKHGVATAEVDWLSNHEFYEAKIKSKNMEDLLFLYRKIRTGTIVPEPGDSWEDKQMAERVEERISTLEGDLRVARSEIETYEKNRVDFIAKLAEWKKAALDLKGAINGARPRWFPEWAWLILLPASVITATKGIPSDVDR